MSRPRTRTSGPGPASGERGEDHLSPPPNRGGRASLVDGAGTRTALFGVRVLLVASSFPPESTRAAARVTEALASELVGAGETVAVITRRPGAAPPTPRAYIERRRGVFVYWLAGGGWVLARPSSPARELDRLFEESLADFRPDVVHVLDLEEGSPEALAAAQRWGAPTVADVEGLQPAPAGLEHAIYPSAEAAADGTRANADVQAHVVAGCALVDSAVASAGPRLSREERGSLHVVAICQVEPSDGLEAVLDSLRLAGLGPVELTVLGRVVDYLRAQSLRVAAEEIPGLRLRLYGPSEARDLAGLLADVDCVLLPSRPSRAASIDTRQALACGVPVAAAGVDGSPAPATSPSAVLSFDRQSPAELGGLLRRIGTDRAFLSDLRAHARSVRVLSPTEHARAVRELYARALAPDR